MTLHPILGLLELRDYITIASVNLCIATWVALAARPNVNLRRLEVKLDAILKHHGIESPTALSPEVQALARNPAQKIAAIKRHREQHPGLGLAEAKKDIEDFVG